MLLAGGGERAEVELVGTHVAGLLRDGVPAGEIAIVLRRPEARGPLLERVLSAYGIPYALERTVPAGHTALGRGLLALLSCALLDGTPDDLLTWLRTPGLLHRPALADELEAEVRRTGARTAEEARAPVAPLPARRHRPRPPRAPARAAAALCDRLGREAAALLGAPWARTGAILDAEEAADARVARELRVAARRARGARRAGSRARPGARRAPPAARGGGGPARLAPAGGRRHGRRPPGDPRPARARPRRVRAAGGRRSRRRRRPSRSWATPSAARSTWPPGCAWRCTRTGSAPSATSSTRRRRAPRTSSSSPGTRPTTTGARGPLALRRRRARRAGPRARRPGGRSASSARRAWRIPAGRRRRARRRARRRPPPRTPSDETIAPLRDPVVLAPLAEREAWSASALETWVACPVRWFVERHLRPQELVPDPEPLVRGELAHAVLEYVLGERAAAQERPVPLREADLPAVRAAARTTLAALADDYRLSVDPQRLRAALHRLEADLVGYLEWACRSGSDYAPARFEVRFGGPDDPLPAVDVGGGLALQGRIDRVDVGPDGAALVYDYKGKTAAPQAKWLTEGRLQVGALHPRAAAPARARARGRPLPAASARTRTAARAAPWWPTATPACARCPPTGSRPRSSRRSSTARWRRRARRPASCAGAGSSPGRPRAAGATAAARTRRSAAAAGSRWLMSRSLSWMTAPDRRRIATPLLANTPVVASAWRGARHPPCTAPTRPPSWHQPSR